MPVARGPQINTRSALLVGATGVVVALLLGGMVVWLASTSDQVDIALGDTDFDAGSITAISREIDDRGPILYSDVGSGGSRDIILQHLGSDPEEGWLAFSARRTEDPRDCFLQWDGDAAEFVLTSTTDTACEPVTVDEAGTGLEQYRVEIRDGTIHVLLNERPDEEPEEELEEEPDGEADE